MVLMTASDLPLKRIARGKVRDIYEVDSERLLLVATDRVSGEDVPHHMISADAAEITGLVPALGECRDQLAGRAMLCRCANVFPIECVIRGYLSGSAWREYAKSGTLAGEKLPLGLAESGRLDPP